MATERSALPMPTAPEGDTTAAAAAALTVLVVMLNFRFAVEWGQGIHLVYTAIAAAVVVGMAASSPVPAERPAGWQSVLFVSSFVLVLATLSNFADVLGADDPPVGSSGTTVWVGLLLVALAGWFATGWNSGISTLLVALTLVVVIVSFIDWVFTPESRTTFRWVFLLIAAGFGAFGAMQGGGERHHGVGFVNAAGVALFILALTFLDQIFFGIAVDVAVGPSEVGGVGVGWELAVLGGGALLIAYSVATAQAGPGYLGVLNLAAFVILAFAPGDDGPSLIGWPLVLILVTIGLFALARGNGTPGAGVPAYPPGPEPSESPTAVQPRP
jgi:hypothetical protein